MNTDNMLAGVIVTDLSGAKQLKWSTNSSQGCHVSGKTGKFYFSDRAVQKRNGKYFVRSAKKKDVEVKEIGENRYELV